MKERYSRQSLIPGWNQESLEKSYVAIVGGNNTPALTSFVSGGLAALGVGKLLLTGERIGDAGIFGFGGSIPKYISLLNSDILVYPNEVRLSNQDITEYILSETTEIPLNAIIDISNSQDSQYCCLSYGRAKKIPVFLGTSSLSGLAFFRSTEKREQRENIESIVESILKFEAQKEGKINSLTLASIIIDETKKTLMPFKGDVESTDLLYKNSDYLKYINKNILMVGAGAIGTFAGISLAVNGVKNLYIADFDRIEIGNLGSQILYYGFDTFTDQNKASVLTTRLKEIARRYCFQQSNFNSLTSKVDADFVEFLEKNNIEAILGCVDNMYTRAVLNMLSSHKQIPYIDGGSGKFGCDVFTVIPGRTACLNCQTAEGLKEAVVQEQQEKRKREERDCIYEPSLIVPNQIAGAMIVNRLRRIEATPNTTKFLSGDGIRHKQTISKCKENCNPYLTIA